MTTAPLAAATGLGSWQIADITAYLQTGRNQRAIAAGPMAEVVMHSTQFMTPGDLSAIATCPKSQPGTAGAAPGAALDTKRHTAGQAIYIDNCAACRGAQGEGQAELIPSLSGNGVVTGGEPSGVLHVILHGAAPNHTRQAPTDPGMPAFIWKLGDAEIAAVASYIRSSWGNRASPVEPGTVGGLRHSLHDGPRHENRRQPIAHAQQAIPSLGLGLGQRYATHRPPTPQPPPPAVAQQPCPRSPPAPHPG